MGAGATGDPSRICWVCFGGAGVWALGAVGGARSLGALGGERSRLGGEYLLTGGERKRSLGGERVLRLRDGERGLYPLGGERALPGRDGERALGLEREPALYREGECALGPEGEGALYLGGEYPRAGLEGDRALGYLGGERSRSLGPVGGADALICPLSCSTGNC